MKKVFVNSILILTGLVIGSVSGSMYQAYADQLSLTNLRPKSTDVVQIFRADGSTMGVNWSQLSRQITQDVNWVGLNTTTGAINWNYIGQ